MRASPSPVSVSTFNWCGGTLWPRYSIPILIPAPNSKPNADTETDTRVYIDRSDDAARFVAGDAVSEDGVTGAPEVREAGWAVTSRLARFCYLYSSLML